MVTSVKIRLLDKHEKPPWELLLLADPSEDQIARYINVATIFIVENDDEVIGICALSETSKASYEIHNIAVAEHAQGNGIGTQLLRHIINFVEQQQADSIIICTADTSTGQLNLYQKIGFKQDAIDKDYFIQHYKEPIFENGRQCRDRVRLKINFQA